MVRKKLWLGEYFLVILVIFVIQNLVRRKNVTEPESLDDLIIKIEEDLNAFPTRLVVDFSFNFLT